MADTPKTYIKANNNRVIGGKPGAIGVRIIAAGPFEASAQGNEVVDGHGTAVQIEHAGATPNETLIAIAPLLVELDAPTREKLIEAVKLQYDRRPSAQARAKELGMSLLVATAKESLRAFIRQHFHLP